MPRIEVDTGLTDDYNDPNFESWHTIDLCKSCYLKVNINYPHMTSDHVACPDYDDWIHDDGYRCYHCDRLLVEWRDGYIEESPAKAQDYIGWVKERLFLLSEDTGSVWIDKDDIQYRAVYTIKGKYFAIVGLTLYTEKRIDKLIRKIEKSGWKIEYYD